MFNSWAFMFKIKKHECHERKKYLCQCDVLGVDVFLEEDGGVFAELLA